MMGDLDVPTALTVALARSPLSCDNAAAPRCATPVQLAAPMGGGTDGD
jgi:hypothetical protein